MNGNATKKVLDSEPTRKGCCYSFTIKDLEKWKAVLENYYVNSISPVQREINVEWNERRDGDTLLIKYNNAGGGISFTITLHTTTGTVCIQGPNKSLVAA